MFRVHTSDIPSPSLVDTHYSKSSERIDCYRIFVENSTNLESFVGCFYRGRLFRIERALISLVTGHKSSHAQLDELLSKKTKIFSAWTECQRNENQLIMCDYQGRTCSWFMVEPHKNGTYLYFGTVLKRTNYFPRFEWLSKPIFTLLLPVHGLYSRLLLSAAARNRRNP